MSEPPARFGQVLARTAVGIGLGNNPRERSRQPAGLERQLQVIERPVLDRGHYVLDLRLLGANDQRHPHALLAEPVEQFAERHVDRSVTQQDDPAGRRAVEELGQVRIDFGMVTQCESRARLFGAGAAVAVDDVKGEALFHHSEMAREAMTAHVKAAPKRSFFAHENI